MEYSIESAAQFIGKRVVVSLRHILANGDEAFTGFWGIVESAHLDGLKLKIEGGLDVPYWELPPDLDAFQPAQHSFYELGDSGRVVTDVDYEVFWAIANELNLLDQNA